MAKKLYLDERIDEEMVGYLDTETEGNDIRIDFKGGYSIWIRNDRVLEGELPEAYETIMNIILEDFDYIDYIHYI